MGVCTTAPDYCRTMAAGPRDDTRDMAALATIGNQLATINVGTNMDSSSTANTSLSQSNTITNRSIVRILVKATVRHHTRVRYICSDGSQNYVGEDEAASSGTTGPELLLRSELSFVMSSSVLLPSPSHNYG